jgi:hypothetical protein
VPNDALAVTWKTVPDTLVASIRFQGKHEDAGAHIGRLSKLAGSSAADELIILYRGGGDMEVCLPVSSPVEGDGVVSRTLEGGTMLCAPFRGRLGSQETGKAIGEMFGRLWRHTIEHHIGVTEEPWREVRAGAGTSDDVEYAAELQVPMLLPKWIGRLRDGLDRLAGEDTRRRVLDGSEGLSPSSDPALKVAWMKGAMERLDAAVEDEGVRREILCGCAHVYPKERIAKLKGDYERLGGVDAILDFIASDPGYDGAPYYRDSDRERNVILIDKAPQEREKFEGATDPVVKRAAACHCPIVKAAILRGEEISFTFCNCGAGWFKPVWEGILGKQVEVICEESVLHGDDRCHFAIYLPEDA